jgi:hypothetical protein
LWGAQAPGEYLGHTAEPTVIVEVLSECTETYDRVRKFELYGSLRVRAERYIRQPDGTWNYSSKTNLEDTLDLKSVDCHLRLADLYKRVALAPPQSPATA